MRDGAALHVKSLKVCSSAHPARQQAVQTTDNFPSLASPIELSLNAYESCGTHMKTALDVDDALLDAQEKNFVANVREHGWFGTHVFADADGPGFSYTTGFWHKFNFPELILFGLPKEVAHEIFWNFCKDLEAGKRFLANEPISEVLNNYDVIIREVIPDHFAEYLGWNRWFYGGDTFKACQVFFPDKSGRFPWSEDTSPEFRQLQPNLAEQTN